jgi:serine/threonine protein kinase
VERVIARGAAATCILARDLRHGRAVALKAFTPGLSAALGVERFRREIAVTAALQHPHILPLFDSGEAAGRLYYVTPYVEGETLRARLAREGALPPAEAVRLARQIADALAHAHARGVVHRDVKPENVLLRDGHVLVADFGIALAAEQDFEQAPGSAGGARLTRTGLLLGTPRYMAPEQATGDRAVDARADVYALGAVLYEALAGEPPFAGPTPGAVVRRVLDEAPRPLAARAPAVPPGVAAAVMTALAKAPADRFPSAAAFAAALDAGLEGGLSHPAPGPGPGPDAGPRGPRSVAPRSRGGAASRSRPSRSSPPGRWPPGRCSAGRRTPRPTGPRLRWRPRRATSCATCARRRPAVPSRPPRPRGSSSSTAAGAWCGSCRPSGRGRRASHPTAAGWRTARSRPAATGASCGWPTSGPAPARAPRRA